MVIGPEQEAEILAIDTFVSADYVNNKPTVTGKIGTLYGIDVVVSNALSADGSDDRECLMYVKSAFTLVMADMFKTRIDEVQEKEYATGFFASLAIGGTRMDEGKVAKVLCSE